MNDGIGRQPGTPLVLVLTTVSSTEEAERLVRTLVEERHVACGNLLPGVASIFRWQGALEDASEVLVLLKTPAERVERLFARVSELHPYEVPELIALPVDAVSQAYCTWVMQETSEVSP